MQWRCFAGLVYERRHLPNLKALLKLYSSISLAKLASLLDGLDESLVRAQLILLKVGLQRALNTRGSRYAMFLLQLLSEHLYLLSLH